MPKARNWAVEAALDAEEVRGQQRPLMTAGEIAALDYDPPRVRCALITFRPIDGRWSVVMAGGAERWREFHDYGVLLFGEPPWRKSMVIEVLGRLRALEDTVSAMVEPDESFEFMFDARSVDYLEVPAEAAPRKSLGRGHVGDRQSDRMQRRAYWDRVAKNSMLDRERDERKRMPAQGSLF